MIDEKRKESLKALDKSEGNLIHIKNASLHALRALPTNSGAF